MRVRLRRIRRSESWSRPYGSCRRLRFLSAVRQTVRQNRPAETTVPEPSPNPLGWPALAAVAQVSNRDLNPPSQPVADIVRDGKSLDSIEERLPIDHSLTK